MIRVVAGLNGSGKSLFTTWLMALPAPLSLYTNVVLKPAHPRFDEATLIGGWDNPINCDCGHGFWDDFGGEKGIKNAHILVDEADRFFDAFDFKALLTSGWNFFKQHQKWGLDITLVTQLPDSLYNRLRRISAETILCSRDNSSNLQGWLKYFLPDSMLKWHRTRFADYKMTNIIDETNLSGPEASRIYGWYDRRQRVEKEHGCKHCKGEPEFYRAINEEIQKRRIRRHLESPEGKRMLQEAGC